MKTSIIFCDGVTQIVMTPETKEEKRALSFIGSDQLIDLAVTDGRFGDKSDKPFTKNVSMCQGGYLRTFNDEESKILVLKPVIKINEDVTVDFIRKYMSETKALTNERNIGLPMIEHLNKSLKICLSYIKKVTNNE